MCVCRSAPAAGVGLQALGLLCPAVNNRGEWNPGANSSADWVSTPVTGGIHIVRTCTFPLRGFYPDGPKRGTGGGHWCCLHLPERCVFCLCLLVWLAVWVCVLYTCVCLCTCWDNLLSLITGWRNEPDGAAATAPLSGSWIEQLLTESSSFAAAFLLCSSWQRCQWDWPVQNA